ncbi:MAG: Ldh family oxidoreductase [Chloroflexi bacterium]|nr:Ldh family oxidoreductase [Chloroflexota bacterium]
MDAARIEAQALTDFCARVFEKLGVADQDARITAEVLVSADLRGVFSHGVAHLKRYVDGLRAGTIVARPQTMVVVENPTTATIDAGAGLGPPVAYRAMDKAIQKACKFGAGFVAVRNSNHYGIAGYYAMMALEHDCIGFSVTNGSPMVVPTFGRNAMLGTNPIAVAAPAYKEPPFVLDMATSTVALGKLEIADQLDTPIPLGWAIDERGRPTDDASRSLKQFRGRAGGGLLPLGGEGELLSGYKGYGLGLWVDIFSGILSGAAYATLTYPKTPDGKALPANVGHFFGAWRIDSFRPADEFKQAMDDLQQLMRYAPKAEGQTRIYIPGEKESEHTARHLREGLPLNARVAGELNAIARELDLAFYAGHKTERTESTAGN